MQGHKRKKSTYAILHERHDLMQIGDGMEFADSTVSPRTVVGHDTTAFANELKQEHKHKHGEMRCSVVRVETGQSRQVLLRSASKDALRRRRSTSGRYLGTIIESGVTPPSSPLVLPRALDDDDSGLERTSASSDKFNAATQPASSADELGQSSPPDSPSGCCLRAPLSIEDMQRIVEGRSADGPLSDAQAKDQEVSTTVSARPDLERWFEGRYQEFIDYASRRDEPGARARRRRITI